MAQVEKRPYKEYSVYQIWPRSFCDGNGDGIGDLQGVYSKLDYIKSLGVDVIWFSPLYPSPNADYGYDISDYKNINPEYGTLDDFKKVLDGAHERGMKVLMDLVVNHTSDEHYWFKESLKGDDNPYHNYYYWRKGKGKDGKKPPNNWLSTFEGGAWEYNEKLKEFYLHVFAKKQPDLNMDNPKVREEVKDILRFWLDMGVDGFREDVITFISKPADMPNGFPLPAATGIEHYKNGPKVHDYLKEFRDEVLGKYDCFTVGESPMMTMKNALPYITEGTKVVTDINDIFKESDYITLHLPLNDATKNTVNKETLALCKDGVRILNFARGGLVNSDAVIEALGSGKCAAYVVDFPSDEIIGVEGVTALPHLGASTPESEDNCAMMAADELIGYIEKGEIKNSVNLPNLTGLGDVESKRVCVICKEDAVESVKAALGDAKSAARKDYGYVVADGADEAKLDGIDGIIKVRTIVK